MGTYSLPLPTTMPWQSWMTYWVPHSCMYFPSGSGILVRRSPRSSYAKTSVAPDPLISPESRATTTGLLETTLGFWTPSGSLRLHVDFPVSGSRIST